MPWRPHGDDGCDRNDAVMTRAILGFALLCAGAAVACRPSDDPYGEAYGRGCLNGFRDAGGDANDFAPKDEARYAADPNYRRGWNEGYSACFERQLRTPKIGGNDGGR